MSAKLKKLKRIFFDKFKIFLGEKSKLFFRNPLIFGYFGIYKIK